MINLMMMGKIPCSICINSLLLLTVWVFITFLFEAKLCNASAMVCEPRQRGSYNELERCKTAKEVDSKKNVVDDFCGHCLNGGGPDTVLKNLGGSRWREYNPLKKLSTAQRAGLCGDPLSVNDHMLGGKYMPYERVPIMAVWKSGSEVDFTVWVDTNQNGFFEFHLCDLDACGTTDISVDCFSKEKKACYRLKRVPLPECESPTTNSDGLNCGPIQKKFMHRWYIACRDGNLGTKFSVGGEDGTMRYKLPDGVTCKHCVLQWHYTTSNSCTPGAFKGYMKRNKKSLRDMCSRNWEAVLSVNPGIPKCKRGRIPEEFWSCVDVQISEDGSSLGDVFFSET